MIPPDDDGIVVTSMSDAEPRNVTPDEFNRELVQALDDLVADARHHGELIQASLEKSSKRVIARETAPPYGEIPERLERVEGRLERVEGRLDRVEGRLERVEGRLDRVEGRLERVEGRLDRVERRLDQVDGRLSGIEQRLDRIEQTLSEIRERMATKVELEETNDNVKKMADGYATIGRRLDAVADLLKLRVVMP